MITARNTDAPGPEYPPAWDEPEQRPCFDCGVEGYVAEMFMRDGGEYVCERCADLEDFEEKRGRGNKNDVH